MTARFFWNQRIARGHRPRLQRIRSLLGLFQRKVARNNSDHARKFYDERHVSLFVDLRLDARRVNAHEFYERPQFDFTT